MEIKLEYDQNFKKANKHFKLMGNKLLIERVELGEIKTKGGLLLGNAANVREDLRIQKPHVGYVLAVGEGYYDADSDKYQPLDVKVGNLVVLNSLGVQYLSTLPGVAGYSGSKVGLTTEGDVQFVFDSKDAFSSYIKALEL
jgi:co-chaperonin GroES (HSP10)